MNLCKRTLKHDSLDLKLVLGGQGFIIVFEGKVLVATGGPVIRQFPHQPQMPAVQVRIRFKLPVNVAGQLAHG